jgi:hypothetical protein
MGWDYWMYRTQPQFFIDEILDHMNMEAEQGSTTNSESNAEAWEALREHHDN